MERAWWAITSETSVQARALVGCASPRVYLGVYWVHDRHVKTTGLKNPVLVSVRRSKLAREIKRP